jgi:hypothetical protein
MSKMGSHFSFGHLKHKLWPKERSGVWFLTTKSWESTDLLACMWRATYRWKAVNEGFNFAFDRIAIEGLHEKLWAPKVAGIPTVGIWGFPFGSPRTKSHLDVASVERCRVLWGILAHLPHENMHSQNSLGGGTTV